MPVPSISRPTAAVTPMIIGAVIFILVASTPWRPAHAQGPQQPPICAPRDALLAALADQYDERPVARAIDHLGQMVEFVVSADGSTWTAIVTQPAGTSCVQVSGKSWQALKPSPPAPGPGTAS